MKAPYTTRRAIVEDGQSLLALPLAALTQLQFLATTVDGVDWWRAPARVLEALITSGRYYVAEQDGRLVGGAGWWPHQQIADTAVLRSVIVDTASRHNGIAAALMRLAEADAVAAGFTHLMVPASPAAAPFYRRLGYVGADHDDLVLGGGLRLPYQRMWKCAA